jgi:hypothetical protein
MKLYCEIGGIGEYLGGRRWGREDGERRWEGRWKGG